VDDFCYEIRNVISRLKSLMKSGPSKDVQLNYELDAHYLK
jgi:hypothetical protein